MALRCALILVLCLLVVGTASAGKPAPPPPFALTAEYIQNNPVSPPWCLNEDDWHRRDWMGSFTGALTVSEYYCDPTVDFFEGQGWDGGGVGIRVMLIADGTLNSLTLHTDGRPGYYGPYTREAEWVQTDVVGHGANQKILKRYEACVFMAPGEGTPYSWHYGPFEGDWTATLSGTFSLVQSYIVEATQFDATLSTQVCPVDQR